MYGEIIGSRIGNIEWNSVLITVTRSILWNENGNDWLKYRVSGTNSFLSVRVLGICKQKTSVLISKYSIRKRNFPTLI